MTLIANLMTTLAAALALAQPSLPIALSKQLPSGYEILSASRVSVEHPARNFEIIALARRNQRLMLRRSAPARPLMIFEHIGSRYVAAGRNDVVVMKADEGGQCDPFLDGDATIAVKGRYFTVQNGVACGAHWTDYITFRFDDRANTFVFDNERRESWSLNPSKDPNADALLRDGKPIVIKGRSGHFVPFSIWRSKG